jgi:putative DNA primase/helicase
VLPSPSQPARVAEVFLDSEFSDPTTRALTLRFWRGDWWHWTGRHWSPLEPQAVTTSAWRFTSDAVTPKPDEGLMPWAPNKRRIADLTAALQASTFLPETVEQPEWLGQMSPLVRALTGVVRAVVREDPGQGLLSTPVFAGDPAPGPRGPRTTTLLACKEGLLDPANGHIYQHSPLYFNSSSVPFSCVSAGIGRTADHADHPSEWLAFLDGIWPDDVDSIELLQDWFGYLLSSRTDLQKMLLLVGPTRSGKGTISRIASELVGPRMTAPTTLNSLAGEFGLQPLIGRSLAIIHDARLGPNSAVAVERLLSISGEDPQPVNRKGQPHWNGKLQARFMICSNEMPRLNDASGAIAGRFLPLLMVRSHLGSEDQTLGDRLQAELPAIFRWSLEGLRRLDRRGRFTLTDAAADELARLRDLSSPVAAFVRECCDIEADCEVAIDDLWEGWKTWAEGNGHQPGSKQTFGKNLRAVVPELTERRPRGTDGRTRTYSGIGLCK